MKWPSTIAKEQAREYYWRRVMPQIDRVIDAQLESAGGVSQFVYRDEAGRFKVIDDPQELEAHIKVGSAIRIFTRLPAVQAQQDVLNRVMDKPAEQVKVTGADDGPIEHVFRWGTAKKGEK